MIGIYQSLLLVEYNKDLKKMRMGMHPQIIRNLSCLRHPRILKITRDPHPRDSGDG